ncbi:MAG: hypothetical protein MHMPM18_005139 [Marteilia pararefringens]
MCQKDQEIKELRAKLEHEASVNKLIAERDLMSWQGKNEERKYKWFYPMLAGAGLLAVAQTIISALPN